MTPVSTLRKTLSVDLEAFAKEILKPHFHSGGPPKKVCLFTSRGFSPFTPHASSRLNDDEAFFQGVDDLTLCSMRFDLRFEEIINSNETRSLRLSLTPSVLSTRWT